MHDHPNFSVHCSILVCIALRQNFKYEQRITHNPKFWYAAVCKLVFHCLVTHDTQRHCLVETTLQIKDSGYLIVVHADTQLHQHNWLEGPGGAGGVQCIEFQKMPLGSNIRAGVQ